MSAVLRPEQPRVRPMTASDIEQVMAIEEASYDFPWTPGIFRDCLRVGYGCWVLEIAHRIAGYGILGVGADEAHLLNLCVDPERRGEGLGRRLLDRIVDLAVWHRAASIFLEVRPSNASAVRLYQRAGFELVGRRPR